MTFTSGELTERVEILGRPTVNLVVSSDRPAALLAVRLCDVMPDGRSTLITRGLLNLTHRDSHESFAAQSGLVARHLVSLRVVVDRCPGATWPRLQLQARAQRVHLGLR